MSDHTIAILTTLWFVILLVGVTFTLLNYRHARDVERCTLADPDATEEARLLARNHIRTQVARLWIFGFFFLMGFAVVFRQLHWIERLPFSLLFYGALELGALLFSAKAVNDWLDQQGLYLLDAEHHRKDDES